MGSLLMAAYGLAGVLLLVSLVCFILVLVEMFRRQQTGLAIACIVLPFIGVLIAFIYGWFKAGRWNLKKVMVGWTISGVVLLAISAGIFAKGLSLAKEAERHRQESQHQQEMEKMAEEMEKMAETGELDIKIE